MPAVNSTFRMSGNDIDQQVGDQEAELGRAQPRDLSSTTYSLLRIVAMIDA